MDQPDACETRSAGAPVLVRRRPRRLQTTTIDNLVHGRIAGSLTLTNHRVSANVASTTPSTLNIHLRPVRSWKHELRRADGNIHTIHILSPRRTLGRILRKHARTGLRVSLPDTTLTLLQVTLNSKVLCDARSLSRALPNTPLDLGPHSHNRTRIRALDLERNTPLNPPEINSWNHPTRHSPG